MSDEFLVRSAPPVPTGLDERVRARLTAPRTPPARLWCHPQRVRALRWLRGHRLLAIAAGVALLAGCATGLVRIAGFVFDDSGQPPEEPPAGAVPASKRKVSREEAIAALTFEVRLPTWAPEGYELTDRSMLTLPEDQSPLTDAWQVWLYWQNDAGEQVLLLAFPSDHYRGDALEFGPAAAEEIIVNGGPAAVVRGNWGGADGKTWVEALGGNVLWSQGGTTYWLQGAWVSIDDLIRMAESQP